MNSPTPATGAPARVLTLKDAIFLTVGGARYQLNQAEYAQLRHPSFIEVPISFIETLGDLPKDGTFLRDPQDGAIFAIQGGAKRHLSEQEWGALGEQQYTNVPQGFLDRIPDS